MELSQLLSRLQFGGLFVTVFVLGLLACIQKGSQPSVTSNQVLTFSAVGRTVSGQKVEDNGKTVFLKFTDGSSMTVKADNYSPRLTVEFQESE